MCMFSKYWVCGESLQGRFRRVSLSFCQVTIVIYTDCKCMCTTENLHHTVHSILKCSVPASTFLCTLLFFVSLFSKTGSSPMTHQHKLYCNITDLEFFPQAKFLIIFWPKNKKIKKNVQENPGTTNQIKDSFLYGDLLIIFFKTGELQKHDLNGQTREEGT